jgi:hypothetical protein
MLKKDKNFRITKQTKRFMASIVDPVARHAYKNLMIDAQLFGAKEFENKKKKKHGNEIKTD